MNKPVLIDIGCCQGGAAAGYQRAGFYVIGVDTMPQPRYCGEEFIVADGIELLANLAALGTLKINGRWIRPAAVHTSWPCQGYTNAQRIQQREHPKLVEDGRVLLELTGLPYIQENVQGAPLKDPVTLCGTMFGLHTYRHRLFESNVTLTAPEHLEHNQQQIKMGRPVKDGDFYQAVGNFSNVAYARADMGVPWMNRDGIRECIPPAYTEHLGCQLMAQI